MTHKRTIHGQGPETTDNAVPGDSRERERNGSGGGAPQVQGDGSSVQETPSLAMQRAEELVDRMAECLGHFSAVIGHKIRWLAVRAREEAEDIWAEAQALRRKQSSQ
jgi:hypothetical protein